MKRISLTICFSLLFVLHCNAQKHVFKNYSVDEGLANSQVRSLFQDSKGNLWVGTLGGISRFDGEQIKNFSVYNGLVDNQINSIEELPDGSLVFGGIGGVSTYNGRDFQSYEFKEELLNAGVNDFLILEDSVLIATEKGLASFKNGTLSNHSHFSFSSENVKSLNKLADGLLILTRKELIIWSTNGIKEVTNSMFISELFGVESTAFMDAIIDEKGRIYVSTSNLGLLELNNGEVDQLSTDEGLASNVLTQLKFDSYNNILVCSKNGLSHIKATEIHSFTEESGLDYTDVRAVIEDSEGRIWMGTDGGGLFKFPGYAFSSYDTDYGLSSEIVMTINSSSNCLYFGSYNNGISIFSDGDWSYFSGDQITNNRVWTSTITPDGNTWFGTSSGIDVFRGKEHIKSISEDDGLSYKKITSLFTDNNGTVWAGHKKGLDKIIGNEIIPVAGFDGQRIRAIAQGEKGVLYFGSSSGVWKFENDNFTHLSVTSNLKEPAVYCIHYHDNTLWTGTSSGLLKTTNGTTESIKLSDNFSSNNINFIQSDSEKNIWLGTNYGLFRIDEKQNLKAFTKDDGLANFETNMNAVFLSNQNLWFGTSSALQCISLVELRKTTELKPPVVNVQNVKLNLEETNWSDFSDHFIKGTGIPVHPEVIHKNNNFSFNFSTNTLDEKTNLVYQYMVEGYDSNWQPITNVSSATYTNLPFKDFRFKVRAKRLGQDWGAITEYPFSIKPPFWQTWWFMIISAILLGYLSFAIFRYRRKNLITALEKEKFEIKSKMLALEQQSLNSSMNRHFIFNALNSIQYYINRQDRLSANRYLSNFAKLIRKNLDSSQVNFTSLADELERLELYLQIENMRFKDKFEYAINVSDSIDAEATQIPSMLLQPYLENSIWHGILPQEKKGVITLDIEKNELGQMEIRIKDNGIGINTSQALKNGKAAHISKGMNITSGRIELLKRITDEKVILIGPFELKDKDDSVQGTQVTIKLPLEYKEVELEKR